MLLLLQLMMVLLLLLLLMLLLLMLGGKGGIGDIMGQIARLLLLADNNRMPGDPTDGSAVHSCAAIDIAIAIAARRIEII